MTTPSYTTPWDTILQGPGTATGQAPAPAAPNIDPDVDPAEDEAIARRLRSTYATIDGLGAVQVRVTSGVVVLGGEVSAQALRQQAGRLAANVRGSQRWRTASRSPRISKGG